MHVRYSLTYRKPPTLAFWRDLVKFCSWKLVFWPRKLEKTEKVSTCRRRHAVSPAGINETNILRCGQKISRGRVVHRHEQIKVNFLSNAPCVFQQISQTMSNMQWQASKQTHDSAIPFKAFIDRGYDPLEKKIGRQNIIYSQFRGTINGIWKQKKNM